MKHCSSCSCATTPGTFRQSQINTILTIIVRNIQLKQILREAEIAENVRTTCTIGASVNMILALAEGRMSQFVRSGFSRLPTENWQEQWSIAMVGFFRDPT